MRIRLVHGHQSLVLLGHLIAVGQVRRSVQRLGWHLQNERDPAELRAACALAMGLTGEAQATPELLETLFTLGEGDALIFGHCVLALAMLEEPAALGGSIQHGGR